MLMCGKSAGVLSMLTQNEAGAPARGGGGAEHVDDVRVLVAQGRGDLDLALEAGPGRRVIDEHDLERHHPLRVELPRPVDHAVAASGHLDEVGEAGHAIGAGGHRQVRLIGGWVVEGWVALQLVVGECWASC